jgi:hypothetical protein
MLTLKFYAKISGFNINMEKTKMVWFGTIKIRTRIIMCFTLLGVKFSFDFKKIVELNYDIKKKK